MESSTPLGPAEPAVSGILARLEQAVAQAGERLLVERLHQVLDEQGSTGLTSLSETLVPLLQALVIVLPQAIAEGTSPAVLTAAQTLGAAVQERGITLPDLLTEGMRVHERLLHEIASGLRGHDRALVAAMLRISHAILEVERAVLLAYQEGADTALIQSALIDSPTGLASRVYLEERLEDELQLVRRRERPLTLALIAVDGARSAAATSSDQAQALRLFASLLRTQLRSIDLAARRGDDLLAVLLPETDREGATMFLKRLTMVAATHEPPLQFSAGIAIAPEQGLSADALLSEAEEALTRGSQ